MYVRTYVRTILSHMAPVESTKKNWTVSGFYYNLKGMLVLHPSSQRFGVRGRGRGRSTARIKRIAASWSLLLQVCFCFLKSPQFRTLLDTTCCVACEGFRVHSLPQFYQIIIIHSQRTNMGSDLLATTKACSLSKRAETMITDKLASSTLCRYKRPLPQRMLFCLAFNSKKMTSNKKQKPSQRQIGTHVVQSRGH